MAKQILKDVQLKYKDSSGTVHDITSQTQSVTINYSAAEQNAPDMTDDTDIVLAGSLKSWSIDATLYQDFTSSAEVDAVLFDEVGKQGEIEVVPDRNSGVSASNPAFHGKCVLTSYPPLGGTVGDVRSVDVTFTANDTLTRNSSAQL